MGLLDSIIPGLGAVSSIFGMVSAADQARRQQAMQQQLFDQAMQQINAQYNNQLNYGHQNLMSMAGSGGDAIMGMGRQLGDQLANAGVFNSSATAGALANAQRDEMAGLQNAAQQMQNQAWQQRQNAIMGLTGQRLGANEQNLNYARQQYGNAAQGFGNYLGQLGNVLGQRTDNSTPNYNLATQAGLPLDPGMNYADDAIIRSINPLMGYGYGGDAVSNNIMQTPNTSGMPPMMGQMNMNRSLTQPNGVMSSNGALTQHNLGMSGANAYRPQLPQINGTINQGINLQGNAGYSGKAIPMSVPGFNSIMQPRQNPQYGAVGSGGYMLGR